MDEKLFSADVPGNEQGPVSVVGNDVLAGAIQGITHAS